MDAVCKTYKQEIYAFLQHRNKQFMLPGGRQVEMNARTWVEFSLQLKKMNFNVQEKQVSCTAEAEPIIHLFIIWCLWYLTQGREVLWIK